jgi:hypothetical protein
VGQVFDFVIPLDKSRYLKNSESKDHQFWAFQKLRRTSRILERTGRDLVRF